jgi:hypothetical protein
LYYNKEYARLQSIVNRLTDNLAEIYVIFLEVIDKNEPHIGKTCPGGGNFNMGISGSGVWNIRIFKGGLMHERKKAP